MGSDVRLPSGFFRSIAAQLVSSFVLFEHGGTDTRAAGNCELVEVRLLATVHLSPSAIRSRRRTCAVTISSPDVTKQQVMLSIFSDQRLSRRRLWRGR